MGAAAGAVWIRNSIGHLELNQQIDLVETPVGSQAEIADEHSCLLRAVLESGEAKLVPPKTLLSGEEAIANPTDFVLLCCPVTLEDEAAGLIELFL